MHYAVLLMLAISTLLSCANKLPAVEKETNLTGTWNWTQRQGGFAGKTETAEKTGNKLVLEFSSQNKYRLEENNQLISEGEYSIVRQKSIYDHSMTDAIHFSDESRQDQLIQSLSADTLILADNHFDGFADTYVRSR